MSELIEKAKWSKNKPTKPGWRFYRHNKQTPPMMITIRNRFNGKLYTNSFDKSRNIEDLTGYFSTEDLADRMPEEYENE